MIQYKLPKIDIPDMKLPAAVQATMEEARVKLAHRPRLLQQFLNCFPNTLETTTKLMDDGTTFVITGDIPAMWLRDSVEQVIHYVPLAKEDPDLQRIIGGLVKRHMMYASHTGRSDIFDERFKGGMEGIIRLWQTEQRHFERSAYRFQRRNCPPIDTLRNEGMGMPVNYTGMIWSGFRPSDDACEFHFNIPAIMFAVVSLRQMKDIAKWVFRDEALVNTISKLEEEVEHGIRLYGTYRHPEYGLIYAYETDGYGNYCLMDDAGTPSLLSIPYLGFADKDDEIYQNTRRFILSKDNPYYYEGSAAKGIGSPHTPPGYVWHMALAMQGLTASTDEELRSMIDMLETTDAGTGFMHEGFHADNPDQYTRSWFAWSNSLFAQLVLQGMKKGLV
ncbi:glycoside hydrolase family 125 protein [Paenibacillus sp. FSL R5-0810]|uniref:glycoside hydrolase family 125 protein n=1 Tax=Paenibacillus sp. FSL R5-0810 TaxID=2921659 RepID=UPI0030FA3794